MENLAVTALAATTGLLDRVASDKRGLVALGGMFLLGASSALGLVAFAGEYRKLPERVTDMEEWRAAHVDTVSRPGIKMARENRERLDRQRRDMTEVRRMVHELYCEEFPARCEGVPSGGEGE